MYKIEALLSSFSTLLQRRTGVLKNLTNKKTLWVFSNGKNKHYWPIWPTWKKLPT